MPEIKESGLPNVRGSTVAILRALYESQIPLANAHVDNQVLRVDVLAATTHANTPSVNELSSIIGAIDDATAKLESQKDTKSIGENYRQKITSIRTKQDELAIKHASLDDEYKGIREEQKKLREMIAKDSPEQKVTLENLKTCTTNFIKTSTQYRQDFLFTRKDLESIHAEMGRHTPMPAIKVTTSATPQLPNV